MGKLKSFRRPVLILVVGLAATFACSSPVRQANTRAASVYQDNKALFADTLQALFARYKEFRQPGKGITEIHVYDFDHTLADTQTMIPILSASGDRRESDSKCFDFRKGDKPNFEVFTEVELVKTAPIAVTVERLKKLKSQPQALVFVVTARSQEHTFQSALRYLTSRGARVDGVLALNSDFLFEKLWNPLKKQKVASHLKKALLIAALVDAARRNGADVRLVRYHEDTDKYIRGFFQLMPSVVPDGRAEAFDYIRRRSGKSIAYSETLVAYAEAGRFQKADGSVFESVLNYDSGDCPLR